MQISESLQTKGKGFYEITELVQQSINTANIQTGLCNIFLKHTSASLILMENTDPSARQDLANFMDRLVPESTSYFTHTAEGPDDMPSHVRSVLTQNSISIPISKGQLQLGTWQGLFLWEHRNRGHRRRLTITVTN